MNSLSFKIATEPDELRQIRELNYRTFVDEIPQHSPNPDRALTDRFEKENTCFVCRRGHDVIGMIALRCNRPFSLDEKLPRLDTYLPPHRSPCEIRLLAVDPKLRNGRVLAGLIDRVYRFFEIRGHDLALISGTLRQTKLYEHLGFVAFGPVVGTPEAPYQPMYQFVCIRPSRCGDSQYDAVPRDARRQGAKPKCESLFSSSACLTRFGSKSTFSPGWLFHGLH